MTVRRVSCFGASALVLALAPAAFAQPEARGRPALEVSIGAGASLERKLPGSNDLSAEPMSLATGSIAGRYLALRAGLLGETRGPTEVARQSLWAAIAVQPFGFIDPLNNAYVARVLRSFSVGVGGGFERLSRGLYSDLRTGYVGLAQLDVPFTGPDEPTTFALRLGAQRFVGTSDGKLVGDDVVEVVPDAKLLLWAGIAVVF